MSIALRVTEFGRPLEFETIAAIDNSTAEGPSSIPAGAKAALVSVRGEKVRWRSDGSPPTTAIGHPIDVDDYAEFATSDLESILFISTSGTNANVDITYYGD